MPKTEPQNEEKKTPVMSLGNEDALEDGASERTSEEEIESGQEEDGGEEREQREPPKLAVDTKRDEIAKRFRELRDADTAGGSDDEADGDAEDEADPSQPKMAMERKESVPNPDDEEIELLVNGQKMKRKRSEVIALAQKSAASDNLLEEAKEVLREAKTIRDSLHKADHSQQDDDEDDPSLPVPNRDSQHRANQTVDREKLAEIATKIQVGDLDEAVDALSTLMETGYPAMNEEQVARIVDRQRSFEDTRTELNRAVKDFGEAYPAIVEDQELSNISIRRFTDEMVKDIMTIPSIQKEDVDKLNGNTQAIADIHRRLRQNGHKFRGYDEISDQVGRDVYKKFGIKSPVQTNGKPVKASEQTIEERSERKRSTSITPRGNAQRQGTGTKTPSREDRNAKAISNMRKARGFN